jgi:serine/threonine protein phosphatase PrpC
VLGSDGLFDFFSNDEVVQLVYQFIHDSPFGDPAKYLIEQVVHKAAKQAGIPPKCIKFNFLYANS